MTTFSGQSRRGYSNGSAVMYSSSGARANHSSTLASGSRPDPVADGVERRTHLAFHGAEHKRADEPVARSAERSARGREPRAVRRCVAERSASG